MAGERIDVVAAANGNELPTIELEKLTEFVHAHGVGAFAQPAPILSSIHDVVLRFPALLLSAAEGAAQLAQPLRRR